MVNPTFTGHSLRLTSLRIPFKARLHSRSFSFPNVRNIRNRSFLVLKFRQASILVIMFIRPSISVKKLLSNNLFPLSKRKLGSGMEHLGLVPLINEYNDGKRSYKLKMVAVFSKNREEWLLLEYANILYNNTMIPLYDTLGIS